MHENLSLGVVLRLEDLHLGFEVFVLSQDYLQAFNVVLLFLNQLLLEHYHLLGKAITPLLYLIEFSIVKRCCILNLPLQFYDGLPCFLYFFP